MHDNEKTDEILGGSGAQRGGPEQLAGGAVEGLCEVEVEDPGVFFMLVAFAGCRAQVEVGARCASLSMESALVLDTVCQSGFYDWFEVNIKMAERILQRFL